MAISTIHDSNVKVTVNGPTLSTVKVEFPSGEGVEILLTRDALRRFINESVEPYLVYPYSMTEDLIISKKDADQLLTDMVMYRDLKDEEYRKAVADARDMIEKTILGYAFSQMIHEATCAKLGLDKEDEVGDDNELYYSTMTIITAKVLAQAIDGGYA